MRIRSVVLAIFLLAIGVSAEPNRIPRRHKKPNFSKDFGREQLLNNAKKIQNKKNIETLSLPLSSYSFGNVPPGESAEKFVFYSFGPAFSYQMGTTSISGAGFAITVDNCSDQIVSAYEVCELRVEFTPVGSGEFTATVSMPRTNLMTTPPSPADTIYIEFKGASHDPAEANANPPPLKEPKIACGSVINVDSQGVAEVVPIVGTPFSLTYSSEFVTGNLSAYNTNPRTRRFNPEGFSVSAHHYVDIFQSRIIKGTGVAKPVKFDFVSGNIWVVDSSGDEIYVFDSLGSHIETRTFLTGATKFVFTHDTDGKLTKITDAHGNETNFNRTSGVLTSIVASMGQVTTVTTNGAGLISEIENPAGESYLFSYKGTTDLLETFTKPGGQVTTLSYNAQGALIRDLGNGGDFWDLVKTQRVDDRLISKTSKLGRETRIYNYSYANYGGSARWIETPSDVRSEYVEYEDGGYLEYDDTTGDTLYVSKYADPRFPSMYSNLSYVESWISGNTKATGYDVVVSGMTDVFSFSSLTKTSVTNGRTTTSVFNNSTKTFTNTSPEGTVFYRTINSHEQPVSTKIGSDTAWTYSYDTYGRLTGLAQGSKNGVTNTYNSAGFLATATNARSEQTSYAYDLAGRVTQITLPDSRFVGYSYDANGNLVGVTPPSRPEHIFGFNAFELMGTYEPPTVTGLSVKNTTYTYNDDKQLTSVIRPDAQTAGYTYNSTTGLLSSLNLARGNNTYQYQYRSEKVSRVDSADGIGSEFTYYGDNVLSETQLRSSDDFLYAKLDYGFDTDHRQISRTLQGNSSTPSSTITTTLNDDDMPTQIGAMALAYSYPSGRLSTTALDKISDSRTYDSYGNLSSYAAIYTPTSGPVQTLYSYTLTRDVMSRISSKSETVLGVTDVYDYSFDTAGRLTTVLKNSLPYSSYTYDNNGNRTSGTHAGTAFTATFDDQDRMLTYNTRVYSYNANGDNTQIEWNTTETSHFSYDALGSLLSITLPDTTSLVFQYDGLGRQARVAVDGVTEVRRIYENDFQIAGLLSDFGVISNEFVYGTSVNSPEYMNSSAGTYRFIKDHLGSTRLLVKTSDGTIGQRLEYTDLGKIISDTSPGYQPYGFAGGIMEQRSKLVKFGLRYYDPDTGRWTTKDPIRFEGQNPNLYSYVMADPINLVDPSGTVDCDAADYYRSRAMVFRDNISILTDGLAACTDEAEAVLIKDQLKEQSNNLVEAENRQRSSNHACTAQRKNLSAFKN